MKTPASRPAKRWTSSMAKRGQRRPWPAGEREPEHSARRQKREAEDPAGAGGVPGDVHAAAE